MRSMDAKKLAYRRPWAYVPAAWKVLQMAGRRWGQTGTAPRLKFRGDGSRTRTMTKKKRKPKPRYQYNQFPLMTKIMFQPRLKRRLKLSHTAFLNFSVTPGEIMGYTWRPSSLYTPAYSQPRDVTKQALGFDILSVSHRRFRVIRWIVSCTVINPSNANLRLAMLSSKSSTAPAAALEDWGDYPQAAVAITDTADTNEKKRITHSDSMLRVYGGDMRQDRYFGAGDATQTGVSTFTGADPSTNAFTHLRVERVDPDSTTVIEVPVLWTLICDTEWVDPTHVYDTTV